MDNQDKLAALRADLDSIDDAILDLIERRLAASAAIAAAKSADEGRLLKLRPRRQAEIISRLQGRAQRIPAAAVRLIWRELMGHTLQAQARTEIVLCAADAPERLEMQVREHFGPAFPISWAPDRGETLRRAREEEAIAIVAEPLAAGEGDTLIVFDQIRGSGGERIAYAIGRISPGDVIAGPESQDDGWSPESWRSRQAAQMPVYPDAHALSAVESRLAASPALVPFAEVQCLKGRLASVARGDALLIQGGDCAESFAEFSPEKVRRDERLLLGLGNILASTGLDIVHVARAAGQFAKPRSSASETEAGLTLPSYRGDAVNGRAFTSGSRMPEPERLLEVYRQSQATLALLGAYRFAERGQPQIYASHEALLLPYEQALTRRDPETGLYWAGSGHMVWIGERTRMLGGAHVEYARGIANPIGLKCGPGMGEDELLRLIEVLDPQNEPGRLVLIGRFGAANAADAFPRLARTTRRAGRNAIWSIDPMHGNGRSVGAIKTRDVADILAETRIFFEVAASEGVHAGGIHLEMSGSDVTECLGGNCPDTGGVGLADLRRHYLSHCDPRLNPAQAVEVATAAAASIGRITERRCDAA